MTDNARIESISMWGPIWRLPKRGSPGVIGQVQRSPHTGKPTCVVLQRPHFPRSQSRENYRLRNDGRPGRKRPIRDIVHVRDSP
jgi:hypothetical protein